MNLSILDNHKKLNDLCDQIFDYFNLTIYDLESKIDTTFSINNIKNKLETFSDKHFKSALVEFTNEMQYLKKQFPDQFYQLELVIEEVKSNFNDMLNKNILDNTTIFQLQNRLKDNLKLIKLY
jgi:ribosomal protein RSM22 (predicted rRNA methylase)